MRILLLTLLLLPLLEFLGSTAVAAKVGWPSMAAWVVLAMGAGVLLLRAQGTLVLSDLRRGLSQPAQLGGFLRRRLLFTLAAILLIVPGVVSDVGALILIVVASLQRGRGPAPPGSAPPRPAGRTRVLEGEFKELPRKPRP